MRRLWLSALRYPYSVVIRTLCVTVTALLRGSGAGGGYIARRRGATTQPISPGFLVVGRMCRRWRERRSDSDRHTHTHRANLRFQSALLAFYSDGVHCLHVELTMAKKVGPVLVDLMAKVCNFA